MRYREAPSTAPVLGTQTIEYLRNHFIVQARVARAVGTTPEQLNRMLKGYLPWDEYRFARVCQVAGIPAELVALWRERTTESVAV